MTADDLQAGNPDSPPNPVDMTQNTTEKKTGKLTLLMWLGAMAAGLLFVPLAFMPFLTASDAGIESVIFVYIIPLPAFSIGMLGTAALFKLLYRVSVMLVRILAIALIVGACSLYGWFAYLQISQQRESKERQTIPFSVYMPADYSGYTLGRSVVLGSENFGDRLYYVPKVYSNTLSGSGSNHGIIELHEFPKTSEFNPPTDCGSPVAVNNDKAHPCQAIAYANEANIYVSDLRSDFGMNYILFTERDGVIITLRTGDAEGHKARMLDMMKSMRLAQGQ